MFFFLSCFIYSIVDDCRYFLNVLGNFMFVFVVEHVDVVFDVILDELVVKCFAFYGC